MTSQLLVAEDTTVPGENHLLISSHWQHSHMLWPSKHEEGFLQAERSSTVRTICPLWHKNPGAAFSLRYERKLKVTWDKTVDFPVYNVSSATNTMLASSNPQV